MKTTLSGTTLRIELPLASEARPSASGKTRVVGTYSGPLGVSTKDGKELRGTITAYTYPEPREGLSGKQSGVQAQVAPPPAKGQPAVLVLEVPTFPARLSSSGKTMLIASASGGTGTKLADYEVMVNVNAFYKA